jgi:hypothetical protein
MIFNRTGETDSQLAGWMTKAGWVFLGCNAITLCPFFWDLMSKANIYQRSVGTAASMALVIGIEAATLTVLFNPRVLLEVLDKPKALLNNPDKTVQQINGLFSFLGISFFFLVAAYVFYLDYDINLKQLGNPNLMIAKILAAVFVLGFEICMGCANIFTTASKDSLLLSDNGRGSGR